MLHGWFLWFILIWIFVFAGSMIIGGFFMFRKFLKGLPRDDRKTDIEQ